MRKIIVFGIILLLLAGVVPLYANNQSSDIDENPTQMNSDYPTFDNVTADIGILAPHNFISKGMSIGQAWGDYNRDGFLDLYVTDQGGPNRLFENNGDGTFRLSQYNRLVALTASYSAGAIWADYDNDGWDDLYVLAMGPNTLFRNMEGHGFEDVTSMAGVGDQGHGTSGSWGDYDNDGWLDLYVANWGCLLAKCVDAPVDWYVKGDRDRLYHNNGDGSFSDVTDALDDYVTNAYSFIGHFVDYDNDGDLDIYVVIDNLPGPIGNRLWRNDGSGCRFWCFTDVSIESGTNTFAAGMGLATGDFDADGDFDFYFSNKGPAVLLQNNGDGTFVDYSQIANAMAADDAVVEDSVSWAAEFFDMDNDGWLDIYLTLSNAIPDQLFLNNGDTTFTEIGHEANIDRGGESIGMAYADYDNDGWVDLVIGQRGLGYFVYRNMSGSYVAHNWISVELTGGGPINRNAIGSRVVIKTTDGRTMLQEVRAGSGMGGGSMMRLHYGLDIGQIETLTIYWTDGTVEEFKELPINRILRFTHPLGRQTIPPPPTSEDLDALNERNAAEAAERANQQYPQLRW